METIQHVLYFVAETTFMCVTLFAGATFILYHFYITSTEKEEEMYKDGFKYVLKRFPIFIGIALFFRFILLP